MRAHIRWAWRPCTRGNVEYHAHTQTSFKLKYHNFIISPSLSRVATHSYRTRHSCSIPPTTSLWFDQQAKETSLLWALYGLLVHAFSTWKPTSSQNKNQNKNKSLPNRWSTISCLYNNVKTQDQIIVNFLCDPPPKNNGIYYLCIK